MGKKRRSFKGIELNRTVGVEIEGYSRLFSDLNRGGVAHSIIKRDGSLANAWHNGNGIRIGAEVVTEPINNLDCLDDVFADIKKYKWSGGRGTAGTHVHVDASDFTVEDKIKMAIFISGIEKLLYMLVKPTRYYRRRGQRNQYCRSMDKNWRKTLIKAHENRIKVSEYGGVNDFLYAIYQKERAKGNYGYMYPNTTRYQMVNIFDTGRKPTVEFRLFHAITNAIDAKKFALLAYHIVETVKNSTLEQLDFIVEVLGTAKDAEDLVGKFSEAIALGFTPKIYNNMIKTELDSSLAMNARKAGVAV